MPDLVELEKRIRQLEDREAIRELMYQYGRCIDNCLWDEVRGLFTEDVTTFYTDGALQLKGVDAILAMLTKAYTRERKKAGRGSVHLLVQPEVELLSDVTAHATFTFTYTDYDSATKKVMGQVAYYHNEFVKIGGQWKIKHIGYKLGFTPTYELPGLEIKPGKFSYQGGSDDAAIVPSKAPKAMAVRK